LPIAQLPISGADGGGGVVVGGVGGVLELGEHG